MQRASRYELPLPRKSTVNLVKAVAMHLARKAGNDPLALIKDGNQAHYIWQDYQEAAHELLVIVGEAIKQLQET